MDLNARHQLWLDAARRVLRCRDEPSLPGLLAFVLDLPADTQAGRALRAFEKERDPRKATALALVVAHAALHEWDARPAGKRKHPGN